MIITNVPGGNGGGGSVSWTKIATVPAGTYTGTGTTIATDIDVGINVQAFKITKNNATVSSNSLKISFSGSNSYVIQIGDPYNNASSYYAYICADSNATTVTRSYVNFGDISYSESSMNRVIAVTTSGIISSIIAGPTGASTDSILTGSIDIYYTTDELF